MKKTKIITFSGLMSALSVAVLVLGSFLEVLDLTAVAFSTVIVAMAFEELRYKALGIYFATAVITVIIFPSNLLLPIEYAIIALYPFIKNLLDKCPRAIKFPLKALYMVVATISIVLLMNFVFVVDETPLYMNIIFIVGGVVLLALLDFFLFRFIMLYRFKLRHQLRIDKFFN